MGRSGARAWGGARFAVEGRRAAGARAALSPMASPAGGTDAGPRSNRAAKQRRAGRGGTADRATRERTPAAPTPPTLQDESGLPGLPEPPSSAVPAMTVAAQPRPAVAAGILGRPDLVLTAGLMVVALTLYLVRLGVPDHYIYDEVYHAYTAEEYVRGNADAYVWFTSAPEDGVAYEWTHPPLGKLLLAGGIQLWGDSSFGWRFASAVFGAIGIGVAYWLGKRVGGSRLVGLLAAGLLLVDGLYFVQSRTGMVDIFVLVFTLGALLSAYDYLTLPDLPGPIRWALVRTGLLLGLALATKWNAAYAAGLIGLVIVGHLALLWRGRRQNAVGDRQSAAGRPQNVRGRGGGTGGRRKGTDHAERNRAGGGSDRERRLAAQATLRERLVWIPLGMGLVPALVYGLSYAPFFLEGHTWSQLIELHRQMWWYHSNLEATHDYSSTWWQWPLAWKPVFYSFDGFEDGTQARIYTNGNPLLFWAMVPAVLWVCRAWWRERRYVALTILTVGFFGQWLPWALSPRISFAYHFLPAVPFGALAVAVVLARLWIWRPGGSPAPRYAAAVYAVAVVIAFAFFYPIYAAVPLTPDRMDLRFWFERWE